MNNVLHFYEHLFIFCHSFIYLLFRLHNYYLSLSSWTLQSTFDIFLVVYFFIFYYTIKCHNFNFLKYLLFIDTHYLIQTPYLTSLHMISFSFLNIFIIIAFKSLSSESYIPTLSQVVSLDCFFLCMVIFLFLCKSQTFVDVKNWNKLDNIIDLDTDFPSLWGLLLFAYLFVASILGLSLFALNLL